MPDRQFVAPFGSKAAPADWLLPASLQIVPKAAWAQFNGAGASGAFKPCLRIISDSGHIAAEAVSETIVAAGASADVTWFPGVIGMEGCACEPTVGVTTETLLVSSLTSTPTYSLNPLASGVTYTIIVEGDYSEQNHALDVGSPDADAMFPTSTAGRNSLQVGIDAETLYAYWSSVTGTLGHVTNFQMSLDGGVTFAHLEPIGGPYASPNPGHLYRYSLVGEGHVIGFYIQDTQYTDNYGSLRVTVQLSNGSGSGSGAGSLVPPTFSTNNDELLATLGGIPTWSAVDGGSA